MALVGVCVAAGKEGVETRLGEWIPLSLFLFGICGGIWGKGEG